MNTFLSLELRLFMFNTIHKNIMTKKRIMSISNSNDKNVFISSLATTFDGVSMTHLFGTQRAPIRIQFYCILKTLSLSNGVFMWPFMNSSQKIQNVKTFYNFFLSVKPNFSSNLVPFGMNQICFRNFTFEEHKI